MRRATTKHDIPNDQRLSLYHELLQHKENGRLPYGKGKELMQQYGLSKQTLSKIWKAGQESKARTGLANVANKKKGRCGRPRRRSIKDLEVAIKAVPAHLRLTLRSLAVSSGIAPTTLWRLLQSKKLRRRTSHLKPMVTEPMVTDKHKADRVVFARSFLRQCRDGMMWHDMMDRVHIDEKWFYVTMVKRRYYLWHDEDLPVRKCSSKRHIIKVMFLTAVARPRYDHGSKTMWDGKIGMWPFVSEVPAQRTSKNRPRGTMVTAPITVTKPVYRDFLVNKVVPRIKQVRPGRRDVPVYIQQDNARPHVQVDDVAVATAGTTGGWRIQLVAQPAMSPDFNVLDLGFFNSIQALQHRQVVTCIDDLVAAVHAAFDELDFRTLDKTFVTLQKVMEESLKVGGDNTYKLPHLHKDKLARQGLLTSQMACDPDVAGAIEAMNSRMDFERRVDKLSSVLESCVIDGAINTSNIDELCTIV